MSFFSVLAREFRFFQDVRLLKKWTGDITPESDHLVADDMEQAADKFRGNLAFRFEGQSLTYGEFDATASRFANWALVQGLKAGDCVALFMENRPDYVAAWTGFAKIGVVTALINHNLEGDALAHCVNISGAKIVVTGAEQDEAIRGAAGLFTAAPKVWSLGGRQGEDLGAALAAVTDARPDRSHRAGLLGKDLCLYVYTSGTTGMPKAATADPGAHAGHDAQLHRAMPDCAAGPRLYHPAAVSWHGRAYAASARR
jgi:fatty-acyl-CoA synthase